VTGRARHVIAVLVSWGGNDFDIQGLSLATVIMRCG
jgi:hypothetical protein